MSRSLSMVKPSGNSSGGAIAAIALNFQPNAAVSTPPQVSRDVKPRHRPSTAPQVSAPLFFWRSWLMCSGARSGLGTRSRPGHHRSASKCHN